MSELKPNKIITMLKALYTGTIRQLDNFIDAAEGNIDIPTDDQEGIDKNFDLEAEKRKLEIAKRKLRIAKQKLGIYEQDAEIREREIEIRRKRSERVQFIIFLTYIILMNAILIFIAYSAK